MTGTPDLFDHSEYDHPLFAFDDLELNDAGQYEDREGAITRFLAAVVGPIPPDERLALWRLASKQTTWIGTHGEAPAHIRRNDTDIYFGLALHPIGYSSTQRGKGETATQIAALWADLDVGQAGHKSKSYPPTFDDARKLIRRMPRSPSIVINSGNGLHAYWCLDRPLRLRDGADAALAYRLMHGWANVLDTMHKAMSWDYDRGVTVDAMRILRLPYTINGKDGGRKAVAFDIVDGKPWVTPKAVYAIDDLLDVVGPVQEQPSLLTRTGAPTQASVGRSVDGLVTRHPDKIPAEERVQLNEIIDAARENFDKFAATWDRKRKDLPSASEYCMALATWGVRLEMTNQRIIDLMTLWRHKHGEKLDLDRIDKALMTITKARSGARREESVTSLAAINAGMTPVADNSSPVTAHQQRLEHAGRIAGIRLYAVLKFTSEPPTYCLVTERGRIDCEHVRCLTDQRTFSESIATAANVWPTDMSRDEWPVLREALLGCIEEVSVGEDATIEGGAKAILSEYCDSVGVRHEKPARKADTEPFIAGGCLHIHKPDVLRWLMGAGRHMAMGARALTPGRLGRMLKALGAESATVRTTSEGATCKRWRFDAETTARIVEAVRSESGERGVDALTDID